MNNTRKFLSDIEVIQKARDTKKLVIFVGSGVSVNSGIPNWNDMLSEIKSDIGIDNSDTEDSLQIAQIYFNERRQKEYIEKVRDILHHKKKRYNEINEAIFDLQPEHVVTTNYDDLLEQVIKNKALPFSVVRKDNDFPYSANSSLLVKIHGDLDNDDFILKEDDYLTYEYDHPLFEAFIRSIFSTKVVLFVGYSFSDINLKIILQKVRNILGRNFQNSYLVTHNSFSAYKINYLREKGVNVLSYEDNKVYIDNYLSGKNVKSIIYKKDNNLSSDIGKYLFDMLVFIKVHDRFKEDLSKKGLIEQMKISLQRFSELNTLPYYFIANLYPFNNSNENIYYNQHSSYSLTISNEELLSYLNDYTEYDGTETKFKKDYIETFVDKDEFHKLKKDLVYTINIINFSAINKLSLEFSKQFTDQPVLISKEGENCECFTCLMNELKINKLIDKLTITDITDASDLQSDSQYAFAHYKVGNIYQSYGLFENIAQKAWHTGKYIVYFIAQLNLKRLGHVIHLSEYKNLDGNFINEISNKSFNIDLDSVYRKINDVSKEESALLKIIRDNQFLEKASKRVSEEYEGIRQLRIDLEKGMYTERQNPAITVEFHLTSVDLFYKRNFIVNDVFSEYTEFFNTGIKALMLNYANYRDYSQYDFNLDHSFCYYFICYGKFDEIKKLIIELSLKNIILSDEDLEKTYNIIINYYSSFFEDINSFSRYEVNYKVRNQLEKASINNRFMSMLDNINLLLGMIDIGEEKFEVVADHLITIIGNTDILYPKNINNMEYFFVGGKKYLSVDHIKKLLHILYKKKKYFTKKILQYMVYILGDKEDSLKIDDEIEVRKLVDILDDEDIKINLRNEVYLKDVFYMVSEKYRYIVRDKIEEQLKTNFSVQKYWIYSMNDIIDYRTFYDKYIGQTVPKINSSRDEDDEPMFHYTFTGKRREAIKGVNNDFLNLFRLLYKFDLIPSQELYDSLVDKKDYMMFFLNPKHFDYSKFDSKWLMIIKDEAVHRKLSEIAEIREAFKIYMRECIDSDYMQMYIKYYMIS